VGDYASAIPQFERTLSLDPKYDDAEIYLGWSYYHLGKYPDATRHFRRVVARQPRWEGAWNGLGWSQYRAGQYQLALDAFQEAVSLDPVYRDAAIGLAYSLFELGRYRDALPHLHRLTREAEGRVFGQRVADLEEVRSRYAWCLYYVGQHEKARAEFVKGLQARPNWHGLHSGLGWTYLKLGDRRRHGKASSGHSGSRRIMPMPVRVWQRPTVRSDGLRIGHGIPGRLVPSWPVLHGRGGCPAPAHSRNPIVSRFRCTRSQDPCR